MILNNVLLIRTSLNPLFLQHLLFLALSPCIMCVIYTKQQLMYSKYSLYEFYRYSTNFSIHLYIFIGTYQCPEQIFHHIFCKASHIASLFTSCTCWRSVKGKWSCWRSVKAEWSLAYEQLLWLVSLFNGMSAKIFLS